MDTRDENRHPEKDKEAKRPKRFSLDELLEQMKPERQHPLMDDPPRGAELL